MTKTIFALVVAVLLTGCGSDCATQSRRYLENVDALLADFDDAVAVAEVAPAALLAVPIGDMQDIRRQAGELAAPECAAAIDDHLLEMMTLTIDGYLGAADGNSAAAGSHLHFAGVERQAYEEARSAVENPTTPSD